MRHRLEWQSQRKNRLAELDDVCFLHPAELLHRAQHQVAGLVRVEHYQPAADRIDRDHVVAHDEGAERFRHAVKRAVPFHADDAVHDREFRRAGEGDTRTSNRQC